MSIIHSAILDHNQKLIVKDSLIMYVCQLQKQYFRDGAILYEEYETKMKNIEHIAESLHLKDLYKHQ
tara:strand:- start:4339 stop:4539 length:201 start_codon:yes stop_codon:yes gene_type:complete